MPAAPDREHFPAGQGQPTLEQGLLAPVLLVVVNLEGVRVRVAVEQVVRPVRLAHQRPAVRAAAGILTTLRARGSRRGASCGGSSGRGTPTSARDRGKRARRA